MKNTPQKCAKTLAFTFGACHDSIIVFGTRTLSKKEQYRASAPTLPILSTEYHRLHIRSKDRRPRRSLLHILKSAKMTMIGKKEITAGVRYMLMVPAPLYHAIMHLLYASYPDSEAHTTPVESSASHMQRSDSPGRDNRLSGIRI